jgi:CIC family chloride channel protein
VNKSRKSNADAAAGSAGNHAGHEELGDFTMTRRVIPISLLAMVIGLVCAFVALALLRLIGLFTNLFYFGKWNSSMVSPAGNHLGMCSVLVPVAGALSIGIMARYGSDRTRGHGIPETIEAMLLNGSRIEPKIALLNPLFSAKSIGSGRTWCEVECRALDGASRSLQRESELVIMVEVRIAGRYGSD